MIWHRFRLSGETSLAAFHYIIQIAQGWQDDHLHQFRIYGKNYSISYSDGIRFPDNPDKITLDDFEFDAGDLFTYEYNFFEHWLHDRFCCIKASSGNMLFFLWCYLTMSLIRKAFRRLHYPTDVIAQCVRWYLAYALSLRNLEEMMAEHGVIVDIPRFTVGSSVWCHCWIRHFAGINGR